MRTKKENRDMSIRRVPHDREVRDILRFAVANADVFTLVLYDEAHDKYIACYSVRQVFKQSDEVVIVYGFKQSDNQYTFKRLMVVLNELITDYNTKKNKQ